MVETTTPQSRTEAQGLEFVFGDIEAVKNDLKERGRFSGELTETQLEEVIPQLARGMIDKEKKRVDVLIRDKSAKLQVNLRIMDIVEVRVDLILENSSEREGEIVAREIKADPPNWAFFNTQEQAEKWGRRINNELKYFFTVVLERRGVRQTGFKFRFTENDTFRIEAENEKRLRELEAQRVSPEKMEIISPPPLPQPAKEPKIVQEPVVIDVPPKEKVLEEERALQEVAPSAPQAAAPMPQQEPEATLKETGKIETTQTFPSKKRGSEEKRSGRRKELSAAERTEPVVSREEEPKPIPYFIKRVKERRNNVEDAWLNLEEARRAEESYQAHRRTMIGPTPTYRISREGGYQELLETAINEQQEGLFATNRYLNARVGGERLGDESILFSRFQQLGEQLDKLCKEKLETTSPPEESVSLLKEYDRILNERLRVFIELAGGRGEKPLSEESETREIVMPDGKKKTAEVRSIKSQPDISGASLVEVSSRKKKGPLIQNLVEVDTDKPEEVVGVWEDFKREGLPVVSLISTSTCKIQSEYKTPEGKAAILDKSTVLLPDLSEGGRRDVLDFDFLLLQEKNHEEKFTLPEVLRQNGKKIVEQLVQDVVVAAKLGLCEKEKVKFRYQINPGTVRLVVDPDIWNVDLIFYNLSEVTKYYQKPSFTIIEESLAWVKDYAIKLGLIGEAEWNEVAQGLKKAA